MGAAAIYIQNNLLSPFLPIIHSKPYPNNPSSTKAELQAIYAALHNINHLYNHLQINIYSDSQAALKPINKYITNLTHPRDLVKMKNHSLLIAINNIIQNLKRHHVKTSFKWIKGHNGNTFNDLADKEANIARSDITRTTTYLLWRKYPEAHIT